MESTKSASLNTSRASETGVTSASSKLPVSATANEDDGADNAPPLPTPSSPDKSNSTKIDYCKPRKLPGFAKVVPKPAATATPTRPADRRSMVISLVAVSLLVGGTLVCWYVPPAHGCVDPCDEAPVWDCACDAPSSFVDRHADYFALPYCEPQLKWSDGYCERRCSHAAWVASTTPSPPPTKPTTTTTTRASTVAPPTTSTLTPSGNRCIKANRTLANTKSPPQVDPAPKCSNDAFCYVFAETAPQPNAMVYFGCYGEGLHAANEQLGCGKSIGINECKLSTVRIPTAVGVSWFVGVLCCCNSDGCNRKQAFFNKSIDAAQSKGQQCRPASANMTSLAPRMGPQMELTSNWSQCGDNGGLCFDVLEKQAGGWQQRRGCNVSTFGYTQCLRALGTRPTPCAALLNGEGAVCCCRGSRCDPGDALAFHLHGDATGSWPTPPPTPARTAAPPTPTTTAPPLFAHFICKTGYSSLDVVYCPFGVCYERLARVSPRGSERVAREPALGCADDSAVPWGMLRTTDMDEAPRCFVVRGEALCLCATPLCNYGSEVEAFVCRPTLRPGLAQLLGGVAALAGLAIIVILIVHLFRH